MRGLWTGGSYRVPSLFQSSPICQASLKKVWQSPTPMSISSGGLPPNIYLWGSSHIHSLDGELSEAR